MLSKKGYLKFILFNSLEIQLYLYIVFRIKEWKQEQLKKTLN